MIKAMVLDITLVAAKTASKALSNKLIYRKKQVDYINVV